MSSTGIISQDEEAIERLERQVLLDRVSAEPEPVLPYTEEAIETETPEQQRLRLGHSKRAFPKRVILLLCLNVMYAIAAMSTATAGIDVTYRFICYFMNIDSDRCFLDPRASEKVASFQSVAAIVRGSLSLAVNTYLSALSDRLGRKPIYVSAMVLTALSHFTSWWIVFKFENPGTFWWLLLPTIIDGCGGGMGIVMSAGITYISDMVPDVQQRTKLLSVLDGSMFFSFALAPMIGSWIMKVLGLETLYILSCCCIVVAMILSSVLLQESLTIYHRRRNSTTRREFKKTLDPLTFNNISDPRVKRNARILLICSLLGSEFSMSFLVVLIMYPKVTFGWSAIETGYLVSTMSTMRTLWFLIGFPFIYSRLSKVWKVNPSEVDRIDVLLMRVALVCASSGYLLMGWSKKSSTFFLSGMLDASSSAGTPIYRSALLKHVPPDQFGTFIGAYNFVISLSTVFGPSIFLKVYSWALSWRPFLPFEIVSCMFATLVLVTFLLRPGKDQ